MATAIQTTATTPKRLRNISEIRRYFHRNETPIYFVSATNFNLLQIDEWARNFKYICYIDCYDGRHPNTFVPSEQPHAQFESIEDINNYLLQHKEVIDYIHRRGGDPKLVFLMFDDTTESIVKESSMRRPTTRRRARYTRPEVAPRQLLGGANPRRCSVSL